MLLALLLAAACAKEKVCIEACTAQDGAACNALGELYEKRELPLRAMLNFERGCQLDDGAACVNFARVIAPRNPRKAAAMRAKACKLGVQNACVTAR